jgi:pyruvate formate lyase activating enzyme
MKNYIIEYDRSKCISCGASADKCFTGTLAMSGVKMSVEEVMAEVIQDADYYRNSGGGVTISGGEIACQPEFTTELLKASKAAGIETAIQTNMLSPWAVYEKMLPYLDIVMLDVKHSDEEIHKRWTGVGLTTILDNAKKISAEKPTIVRTPIIPGVNDSAEEIAKIAKIIKGFKNIVSFDLVMYNPLGESKYEALGMEHEFKGARSSEQDLVEALVKAAQGADVPVKIM